MFLITRILIDGVGLTVVLGDLVMNEGDDVGADGSPEDGRKTDSVTGGLVLERTDRDKRASSRQRLKENMHHVKQKSKEGRSKSKVLKCSSL